MDLHLSPRADAALPRTRPAPVIPVRQAVVSGKVYFHTLAAMRGVAALFVLVFHAAIYFPHFRDPMGFAAVDLFFLLSGAVIEASYGNKLRAGMTLTRFMRLRAVRLYPLYILGAIIMLGAVAIAPPGGLFIDPSMRVTINDPVTTFMFAAAFVPLLKMATMFPLNPPAWSLFFELAVNLAYAAIAPKLGRRSLIGIIAVAGLALVPASIRDAGHGDFGVYACAARASFSFSLGVLMCREAGKWKPTGWIAVALPVLSIAIVCLALASSRVTPEIYLAAVFIAFPVAVWLALHAQPATWAAPVWDALGDMSYPIYAVHVPLIVFVLAITGPITGMPWAGVIGAVGLVVIAWALDRFYDRPLRQWLRPRS